LVVTRWGVESELLKVKITISNMKYWTYQDCTCASYFNGTNWHWSTYHVITHKFEKGIAKSEKQAQTNAEKTARKFAL